MTVINSRLPVRQQNAVAFTSNDKPKKHPIAAVASFVLPGSGQLLNGDKKSGLTRLGLEAGILGSIYASGKILQKTLANNFADASNILKTEGFFKFFKEAFKGFSKTKIAGGVALAVVPIVALAVNHVNAAKDAYNSKNKESETT